MWLAETHYPVGDAFPAVIVLEVVLLLAVHPCNDFHIVFFLTVNKFSAFSRVIFFISVILLFYEADSYGISYSVEEYTITIKTKI